MIFEVGDRVSLKDGEKLKGVIKDIIRPIKIFDHRKKSGKIVYKIVNRYWVKFDHRSSLSNIEEDRLELISGVKKYDEWLDKMKNVHKEIDPFDEEDWLYDDEK